MLARIMYVLMSIMHWQAYRTWLGFYKGFCKLCKWDPTRLVQAANHYAATLGALTCFIFISTVLCCASQ
jgi:hypothetical protein